MKMWQKISFCFFKTLRLANFKFLPLPEDVVEVKVVVVVDTIGVTVYFLNFFLEPYIDVTQVHLPISIL